MIQQILHTYKLRLTNISQGSRALKLARLSKRKDVDGFELGYADGNTPEELLRKILAGKSVRLIQKLDPRFEKTNLMDARLNAIYRELQTIFEETGSQDLYVGYPFVEGKFSDGTAVRCPLLLFPVALVRQLIGKARWQLNTPEDAQILLNPTFFLAYERYQQTRLPQAFWEESIEYQADWQLFLNDLYQFFQRYELDINFNTELFDFKLQYFTDYNKEVFEAFPVGSLTLKPQMVLGIFPQSDSALMQDYETIAENLDAFAVEQLFLPRTDRSAIVSFKPEFMPEETRLYVSDIDPSQEEAILKVKAGKSIVLHGPPGTGKSQVIVNLIAEAMAQGLRVLVVSQKRAALDVVYKRLEGLGLGRYAALVHDEQSDRLPIFQQIRKLLEDLPDFEQQLTAYEQLPPTARYDAWARQADSLKHEFQQLYDALQTRPYHGYTLQELYTACRKEIADLPLSGAATRMDKQALATALQKFAQLLDYQDFFQQDYPWASRLSFHLYEPQDQQILVQRLQALPNLLGELSQTLRQLQPLLGQASIDPQLDKGLLPNLLKQVKETHAFVADSFYRKGILSIEADKLSEKYVQQTLDKLQKQFKELGKCGILSGFSWEFLCELRQRMTVFQQKQKDFLRFASSDFRKSKQFIQSVFSQKNIHWNEQSFGVLQTEMQMFQTFLDLFLEIDEQEFFKDFRQEVLFQGYEEWEQNKHNLHDFKVGILLDGWQEWLEAKKEQFEAWKKLKKLAHLPALQPQTIGGSLDENHWQQAQSHLKNWEHFHEQLLQTQAAWRLWLAEAQIAKLLGVVTGSIENRFTTDLQQSFQQDFEDLKQLDALIANFSEEEQALFEAVSPLLAGNQADQSLISRIEHSVYHYWILEAERENPVLTSVSTRGFERKQQTFAAALQQKQSATAAFIQHILQKRLKNGLSHRLYKDLYHQTGKKRKLWTVRKLIQETWDIGLADLLPCWLASPESAAAVFPMQAGLFDWVIFDEASQCYVEKALPVMLRARQSVIAGDDKQLAPFDLYAVRYEEEEFVENEVAMEVESALDLAKTQLEHAHLTWHYRSQQSPLIAFSNLHFYENRLQFVPPAQRPALYQPALEWVSVTGSWKENRNQAEAEKMMQLVEQWLQQADKPTLGIVTFNFHQQELIKDLIDKRLEQLSQTDEALYQLWITALNRSGPHGFEGLFVKNIENVQGDERDLILFSVGYAHNELGKLPTFFGTLNRQGGQNRLNVAISRARKKIVVLCSFDPSELKVEESKFEGPKLLKAYLQYVKTVSSQQNSENLLLPKETATPAIQNAPISAYFAQKLREAGYFVLENYGDTRFKLDLVVKAQADSPDFLLAIVCEGSSYLGKNVKESEVFRPQLLQQKGWKVQRIWARNFFMDKEKEWEKVRKALGEG